MISSAHPDLPAFLAHLKRVEEARKFVAEFDEWLAGGPPQGVPPQFSERTAPTYGGRESLGRAGAEYVASLGSEPTSRTAWNG